MNDSNNIFQSALLKLLRPLVRILLRNGVTFQEFTEVAKHVYVQVATEDFDIDGKRQTDSRISTITGLTRKEVLRIRSIPEQDSVMLTAQFNRAARVIHAWVNTAEYCDEHGEPMVLPFNGEHLSFSALVKKASGDIPVRTILDELLNVGVVEYSSNKTVKLLNRAYIPAKDNTEKIKILGTDVADLVRTIDHNLSAASGTTHFQRKVCYDNLPAEVLPELKQVLARKAQFALESMNEDMMRCDRDRNHEISGSGRKRAGVGIFYFEEDITTKGQ